MILIFFIEGRTLKSSFSDSIKISFYAFKRKNKSLTHHRKKIFDLSQGKRSLTHQIL